MEERLQKILAGAGVGSRRECEQMIADGRIQINGELVTTAGLKIDPQDCAIKVDGKLLTMEPSQAAPLQYMILHKPPGVLTTMKADAEKRPTLLNLLNRRMKVRVYPVGRLDFNSEGLLLLTNDGELAYRLTHPKFKLAKVYEVKVHGLPSKHILDILSNGVNLEDGRTRPAKIRILRTTGKNTWMQFIIHEGKKRQIRRMCEKVRLHISKLKRVKIGPISLHGLARGQERFLRDDEIRKLKEAVHLT